jgi:hypothetical protein
MGRYQVLIFQYQLSYLKYYGFVSPSKLISDKQHGVDYRASFQDLTFKWTMGNGKCDITVITMLICSKLTHLPCEVELGNTWSVTNFVFFQAERSYAHNQCPQCRSTVSEIPTTECLA